MRRSHLYIILLVLLCAASASAVSKPVPQIPEGEPAPAETPDSIVDMAERTLVSEVDSDSIASLPLWNPEAKPTQLIRREKVDLDNVVNFTAKDSV